MQSTNLQLACWDDVHAICFPLNSHEWELSDRYAGSCIKYETIKKQQQRTRRCISPQHISSQISQLVSGGFRNIQLSNVAAHTYKV